MITYLGIELKLSSVPVSKTPWLLWRNEYWKYINGYDLEYMVSSQGRIASLKSGFLLIMRACFNHKGYLRLNIGYEATRKHFLIHRAVMDTFKYVDFFEKAQVNHKNGVRHDNRIENLEWVSNRGNSFHRISREKTSSIFTGVSYYSCRGKWVAQLTDNKERVFIGRFDTEMEAAIAYKEEALKRNILTKYAITV